LNARTIALVFFASVMVPRTMLAQDAGAAVESPFRWAVGMSFGTSQHAAAGHIWGLTKNREHYIVGIHADVPVHIRPRWTLSWAPGLTPLLVLSKNPYYRLVQSSPNSPYRWIEDGRGPVVGFGMTPIGLEVNVTTRPRLQPYASGAVGSIWFTRNTPSVYARRFNFVAEFGGGVRWQTVDRYWLRVGYKFHHFSNAHTAPQNPGVDGHVVYVGFDRVVTHRRK